MKPLDFLFIGAHPDDVEIGAGGLALLANRAGLSTGILDLTRGELGSRGDGETRDREAELASEKLGLSVRLNLDLGDARLVPSLENREKLARSIARMAPRTLVGHLGEDLHPDHNAAAQMTADAWHLSGLPKLMGGNPEAHRPGRLLQFPSYLPSKSAPPDLILDISAVFEAKMDVIQCFSSQHIPNGSSDRGEHFASNVDILARSEINARYWGSQIGVPFGEPLYHRGPMPADLTGLLQA